MTRAVDKVVRQTTDQMAGGPVELYRYRTAEDQARSPHASSLPLGAHAMLVAWTADALEAEGFDVAIKWARAN